MSEFEQNWKSVWSDLDNAITHSNTLQSSLFKFGMQYLDDALYGLCNHDVVLVGAPSGGGKTTLATLFCRNFAKQGKKVSMFALEAMENEITYRLAHSLCGTGSFSQFLFELSPKEREHLIRKAQPKDSPLDLIKVFYKKDIFTPKDLTREMYALENNTDVVILDYFGFIDLSGDKNEFTEQKELVNEINRLQKIVAKPIIILAQFNKAFSKSDELFPSLSDFYGTSALANMCTKAITISNRTPSTFISDTGRMATTIHIPKFRFDGDRSSFFAVCPFISERADYAPYYYLFNAASKEIITQVKIPRWAVHVKESKPYGQD